MASAARCWLALAFSARTPAPTVNDDAHSDGSTPSSSRYGATTKRSSTVPSTSLSPSWAAKVVNMVSKIWRRMRPRAISGAEANPAVSGWSIRRKRRGSGSLDEPRREAASVSLSTCCRKLAACSEVAPPNRCQACDTSRAILCRSCGDVLSRGAHGTVVGVSGAVQRSCVTHP